MRWVELSVQAKKDEADEVALFLGEYGQGGAVIEKWPGNRLKEKTYIVKIYLPLDRSFKEKKSRIQQTLQAKYGLNRLQLKENLSRQEDWFDSLKQHFSVLEVGETIIIKASWSERPFPSYKKIIELDPGYAFGTGLHPTTRLCLIHLEKNIQPGMTVLDVGTGSGILAIAAAKMGASYVLALDKDSNAIQAANNNVGANSVENIIKVRRGTLSLKSQRDLDSSFDLVVANIISRVIASLASRFTRVLKPGGKVIASGINAQGLDEVLISFTLAGLKLEAIYPDGEWYAVVASYSHSAKHGI